MKREIPIKGDFVSESTTPYLVRLVPGFAPGVRVPSVDRELLHVGGFHRGRRC